VTPVVRGPRHWHLPCTSGNRDSDCEDAMRTTVIRTRTAAVDGYEMVMIAIMVASTVTFWFVH